MTTKSSKDLRTPEEIDEWLARLGREWPERQQMARFIADRVARLPVDGPQVVELAPGSGYLAGWLLRTVPNIRYIGFDRSPYLLDYARRHLAEAVADVDGAEFQLHEMDLNEDGWIRWLERAGLAGRIDAAVSLQSFHDLGGEAEQGRAYGRVRTVLRPGGLFVNADLLLDPENPHPRRLSAYRHLELLREAGFERVDCALQAGEFGCFVAWVPAEAKGGG